MNKAVGNRRLLKLAAFLKQLPKERFYFGHWVGADWKGSKDLSCGTTACALGWATAMPEFQRLGLYLKKNRTFGGVDVALAGVRMTRFDTSIETAMKFFGLSEEEALFLFIPGENMGRRHAPGSRATPLRVGDHIERFVKDPPKVAA